MSHLGQISDASNKLDSTWKLFGCMQLVLNLVIKICFGVLFKTFCPVFTERWEISQTIFLSNFVVLKVQNIGKTTVKKLALKIILKRLVIKKYL